MAKSKKPESSPSDKGATKKQATETKKAATGTKAAAGGAKPEAATKKKTAAKPAAGGGGSSVPLIDTSLAAQAAARMLISRVGNASQSPPAEASEQGEDAADKRETSAFKQMKNSLGKPSGGGIGGALGAGNVSKKGNTGFGGGNRQVGRNQTFGADVNRAGVPRRTGG